MYKSEKNAVKSCLSCILHTNLYLGDHWEYRPHHGGLELKVCGAEKLDVGNVHIAIKPEDVRLLDI